LAVKGKSPSEYLSANMILLGTFGRFYGSHMMLKHASLGVGGSTLVTTKSVKVVHTL
jgi:hypothetical protein